MPILNQKRDGDRRDGEYWTRFCITRRQGRWVRAGGGMQKECRQAQPAPQMRGRAGITRPRNTTSQGLMHRINELPNTSERSRMRADRFSATRPYALSQSYPRRRRYPITTEAERNWLARQATSTLPPPVKVESISARALEKILVGTASPSDRGSHSTVIPAETGTVSSHKLTTVSMLNGFST